MKVSIKKITNILLFLYCLLFILSIIISNFYKLYGTNNVFLILNFLILITTFILNKNYIKFNFFTIITLIYLCIFISFSFLFNLGGLGSLINLINFILGLFIFSNIKISHFLYKFLTIGIILSFFINCIRSQNVYFEYLNGVSIMNPNTVAAFLLFLSMILDYLVMKRKKIKLSIFLNFITIFCIFKCESRGSLFAYSVFLLLKYFKVFENIISKNRKKIFLIVLLIGAMFPLVYVLMYENNINFSIPFINKSLYTGRERLWGTMLEELENSKFGLLLGLGTNHQTSNGLISNYHNWYLGFLYTFGAPSLIIYFIILINNIMKIESNYILYAFISLFVFGLFESAALSPIIQMLIFLLLIFDRKERMEVKKNEKIIKEVS